MNEDDRLPDGTSPQEEPAAEAHEDISDAVNVEQILEFYKDKPVPDNAEDTVEELSIDTDKKQNGGFISALFDKIPDNVRGRFKKDAGDAEGSDDGGVHDASYGISPTARAVITYAATALTCAAIIGGAFALSALLPTDEAATEEYAARLREEDDYVDLKADYDRMVSDTDELKKSVGDKKTQAGDVTDYDNAKADLRAQIDEKSAELQTINGEIADKTARLADIDAKIAEKTASNISLSPGRYTVGKDIPAGRYNVVGTGAFAAASSDGSNKYNTTLGSTPYEVSLNAGDRLKLGSTVLFTPVQ